MKIKKLLVKKIERLLIYVKKDFLFLIAVNQIISEENII